MGKKGEINESSQRSIAAPALCNNSERGVAASPLQSDGFASGSFHKQVRTPRLLQILNMLLLAVDTSGGEELNYAGPAWRIAPSHPTG